MSYSLIEEALGHPARIRVLRTLHKPGAGYMSLNQLAKVASLNAMTLSRTLRSLQDLGLVNYVQAGNAQLWRLSEGYAARTTGPILDAIGKIPNIAEIMKETICASAIPPEVKNIILFGSIARGENTTESDVDIFILKSKKSNKGTFETFLNGLTEKISKNFWMNPSFLIKTISEWKKVQPKLRQNILKGIVLYEKKSDKRGSKN